MSQLSTLALARASDAREIAEMSRDLIEEGLTWSWTPARVQHFIMGAESSVVVARRGRSGDGRQLMDWLTATAIEAGVFRINLELRTQNTHARAFYENLGFDQLGVVQGYYQGREAALRMSRHLAVNPV